MSLISPSALSGLELTFYSGVYGTSIGAMTQFGSDAKGLIGISGICIGIGEIIGGSSVTCPSLILVHDAAPHPNPLSLSGQEGASLGC